jgi:hypothetical protein
MRVFLRLEDLACHASARLDRHPVVAFAVVGLLIAVTTLSMAASKPLWHDEIFTVLLAGLGAADLWTANLSGVDLSPPLNTLLTHFVISMAGTGPVAARLAPLIGFWLAIAVIFEFVRRRSTTVTALTAALLPGFTAGYRYSYEARGYGLMMGFAALSLFAWAEAAAGRRRGLHVPLLAAALAAGYWTHFYGVFAAAPVIAGELARSLSSRKIDAAIWAGLALSFLTLIPLVPLISAGASLAPTFWRRVALSDVLPTYSFLLNALLDPAFLAGLLMLILGALAYRLWFTHLPRPAFALPLRRGNRELPGREVMALAVSVALPAIQIVAALATTGVFVPRYALLAVPGLCIAIALATVRLTEASVVHVLIAGILIVSFAVPATFRPSFTNPAQQRPALMELLAQEHPVSVTGGLMYLQLWYYTPPEMREHLYYLADPGLAWARTGSDSIDRGLLGLARWSRLNVLNPETFTATNREFRVYGAGSGWLIDWLSAHDARIEELDMELGVPIFAVRIHR